MKKSYEMDMCSGPLLSKILIFSIPLMISGILQLLFNAADIVVVGRFTGSEAMAAVGSTSALINLIINLFVGISVGANVVVARNYGARDYDGVHGAVHTSVLTALIGGVFLIFVGIALARPLLELMGTPDNVIDQSVLYMRIYFVGMPSFMLYNFGSAILRAIGDTKRPLYFLTLAGVINVFLNLFFVIVFHMGVAGVALATIISQTVSAILVLLCLMKMEGPCHLDFKHLKFHLNQLGQMLRIGLPAGLQGIVFSLSNVLIQSSVNSFGSQVMAGNTAASNIEGFVYNAMNAVYQTSLSFTSQNMGAKQFGRVNKILFECLCVVSAVGILLGGGAYLLGEQLLSIYTTDPGGYCLRHHPYELCLRDLFPVRPDGRHGGQHPRHGLFDHADAGIADRRLRVPYHLDLHHLPGGAHAGLPVHFLPDFLDPDSGRSSALLLPGPQKSLCPCGGMMLRAG